MQYGAPRGTCSTMPNIEHAVVTFSTRAGLGEGPTNHTLPDFFFSQSGDQLACTTFTL